MYVGITRARRRLVLSRSWYYRDNVGSKEPSPFWEEALATGLVAAQTVECPPENPYPLGVDSQPDPERDSSRRRPTRQKSRGSRRSSSAP